MMFTPLQGHKHRDGLYMHSEGHCSKAGQEKGHD